MGIFSKDITIAKEILRLRLSQMIVNEKYKAGEFKIPLHVALGHEAIAVAVDAVMQGNDQFVGSHRNMHYNLARAKALKPILDEYLLKKEGLAGGMLGSMNLSNETKGIIYSSSILGNNFSVATGLALGQKVKKTHGLVIVQVGDGAIEEGAFWESMLSMKSLGLAVLILLENNGWSMHTRIEEHRCNIDLAHFAGSLGAEYANMSGNDVYEYIERLGELRKKILADKSPFILEVPLKTLGGWYVGEGDQKRFIHPHSGPVMGAQLSEWPEMEQSEDDPVFVLRKYFEEDTLENMAKEILQDLKREIGE